jgi:hypothetical protein
MPVRDRQAVRLRIEVPETAPERRAEHNLWTAMRSLKRFTPQELLFAASTDELKISEPAMCRYLLRLRAAGLLAVQRNAALKSDSWFLKPGANTGPKPPRVIQLTMVWDDNSRIPVGDKIVSEERA